MEARRLSGAEVVGKVKSQSGNERWAIIRGRVRKATRGGVRGEIGVGRGAVLSLGGEALVRKKRELRSRTQKANKGGRQLGWPTK